MKNKLISLVATFTLALLASCGNYALAQPSHIGLLYSASGSDGGDGNGLSNGIALKWKLDSQLLEGIPKVKVSVPSYLYPLSFVGEIKFSRDYKGYLDETGSAYRTRLLARYAIPNAQGVFIEAGGYFGHTTFPDTSPTIRNGYSKRNFSPLIGVGFAMDPFTNLGGSVEYIHFGESSLYANSSTSPKLVRDGGTRTERLGIDLHMEPFPYTQPKWSLLVSANMQLNSYRRDCALYGTPLCSVTHNSKSWEIQLGVARRF